MELSSPWGILSQLLNLLRLVPSLIILGGCIYLYSRQKNSSALLMALGAGIEMVLAVAYQLLTLFYARFNMAAVDLASIYTGLGVIGLAGGVLFAVGLLRQISHWVNLKPPADY
jgi:hypothetical protein